MPCFFLSQFFFKDLTDENISKTTCNLDTTKVVIFFELCKLFNIYSYLFFFTFFFKT